MLVTVMHCSSAITRGAGPKNGNVRIVRSANGEPDVEVSCLARNDVNMSMSMLSCMSREDADVEKVFRSRGKPDPSPVDAV